MNKEYNMAINEQELESYQDGLDSLKLIKKSIRDSEGGISYWKFYIKVHAGSFRELTIDMEGITKDYEEVWSIKDGIDMIAKAKSEFYKIPKVYSELYYSNVFTSLGEAKDYQNTILQNKDSAVLKETVSIFHNNEMCYEDMYNVFSPTEEERKALSSILCSVKLKNN